MDWGDVDYCDAIISCLDSFWRHPFTAVDPLLSKWRNATFIQIFSDLEWLESECICSKCSFLGELFNNKNVNVMIQGKRKV